MSPCVGCTCDEGEACGICGGKGNDDNDVDTDETTVEDKQVSDDAPHNERADDESNDGDDDAEDRPVTVDLTRSEALTLLHVAWKKEIEWSGEAQTAGLAQLMGSVATQVGKEIYNEDMVDWVRERQAEQEEMMEELQERMGNQFGGGNDIPQGAFQ